MTPDTKEPASRGNAIRAGQSTHLDAGTVEETLPRPFALWADPVRRPVRAAYVRAYAARYESGIASGNLDAFISGRCDSVPTGRGVCNPERAKYGDKLTAARDVWRQGVPEDLIRDVAGIPAERSVT